MRKLYAYLKANFNYLNFLPSLYGCMKILVGYLAFKNAPTAVVETFCLRIHKRKVRSDMFKAVYT